MIEINTVRTDTLTTAEQDQLIDLAYSSRDIENINHPRRMWEAMVKDYCTRDNSFITRGYLNDNLISMCFFINLQNSDYINTDLGIQQFMLDNSLTVDNSGVTALLYVIPEHRGNGYGIATEKEAQRNAKANGYLYILGFGELNDSTESFYNHNYPSGPIRQFFDLKDYKNRNISIFVL